MDGMVSERYPELGVAPEQNPYGFAASIVVDGNGSVEEHAESRIALIVEQISLNLLKGNRDRLLLMLNAYLTLKNPLTLLEDICDFLFEILS